MGGVILSRPKAVVVRFVRAESIRGGRTSKDPQWLPEAIHPEARLLEAYLVHTCKAL